MDCNGLVLPVTSFLIHLAMFWVYAVWRFVVAHLRVIIPVVFILAVLVQGFI